MADLEGRFKELADVWEEETGFLADPGEIMKHPNYAKIVEMGEPAIPLVLEYYANMGSFLWCAVLTQITGENPVPKHHAGLYNHVRDDWLTWGHEKGYINHTQTQLGKGYHERNMRTRGLVEKAS